MANGDHKNLCGRSLRSFFGGFMSVLLASTFILLLRTDDSFGRTLVEFRSIIIGSSQKSKFVCSAGKRYVNGTCVCPVLFSGSDDCKRPWGGIRPGCVTPMRALPLKRYAESVNVSFGQEEFDRLQGDLPRLSTFDTCAVVGSSSSLVNGGRAYGREIDSHTAVIRFNDAPTKGFERWVGSTTTLRIQNVIHCGFAESPHELCMRYTLNETSGDEIDTCKNEYRCRRVKGTHPMVFYAMDYWRLAPPPVEQFEPHFRKLSAGFFGIALSLHLCGQVDVYGIEGKKSHYFIKRVRGANRKSFKKRHNWAWERWCLKELKQGLLPRIFIKWHIDLIFSCGK